MIIMYTKDNCQKCDIQKAKFNNDGIVYKEIYIHYAGSQKTEGREYIDREKFIDQFPNVRSLPHIVEI